MSGSRERKRQKAAPGHSDPAGGASTDGGGHHVETPEERHQRRLLKKQRKMERRAAEKELFGYTNEDNPFGDANLTRPFVWKKKWQKLKEEGTRSDPVTRQDLRQSQLDKRQELEDLKRRRQLREQELREAEEERAQLQRDLDWAANVGWEEREEAFERRQAGLKSRIRLREGRERPVDLLWRGLRGFQGLQQRRYLAEGSGGQGGEGVAEAGRQREQLSIVEDEEEIQRREEEDLANADSAEAVRLIFSLAPEDLQQLGQDIAEEIRRLPPAPPPGQAPAAASGPPEGLASTADDLGRLLDAVQESETRWADPEAVEREYWAAVEMCAAAARWKIEQEGGGGGRWNDRSRRLHPASDSGGWGRRRHDDRRGIENQPTFRERMNHAAAGSSDLDIEEYAFQDVHPNVRPSFRALLAGKSLAQLERLTTEVAAVLARGSLPSTGGAGAVATALDFSYWEALRRVLRIYTARVYLQTFHERLLMNKLEWLRRRHMLEAVGLAGMSSIDAGTVGSGADSELPGAEAIDFGPAWEPRLYPLETEVGDLEVIDEDEDFRLLERQRSVARDRLRLSAGVGSGVPSAAADLPAAVGAGSQQRLGDGEAGFSVEAPAATAEQAYLWQDKYRPRKPRYFNRVKTGYEWNKYNRTHYEKENPPPKIVQGYKFNIFYPDLIDASTTPVYLLEPIPGEPDHCIIRFRAGAPYEDLAFKIVKKEWDYNRRRGFRCVFDKGVLQLYFSFKRYFYRR